MITRGFSACSINPELSALEFNSRILHQAEDSDIPLLERLDFLRSAAADLDRFVEIRLGPLEDQTAAGNESSALLHEIRQRVRELVGRQHEVLEGQLLPELAGQGIRCIRLHDWSRQHRVWLHGHFRDVFLPLLAPIALDPARPFPRLRSQLLHVIVELGGTSAFGRPLQHAIVPMPQALQGLIQLDAGLPDTGPYDFVLPGDMIEAFAAELFSDLSLRGCHRFRLLRRHHPPPVPDETAGSLEALAGSGLPEARGQALRLELESSSSMELSRRLRVALRLGQANIQHINTLLDMRHLATLQELPARPDLRFPAFRPALPPQVATGEDLFAILRRQEILLHHPFESFEPILRLITLASRDPQVLSIKMMLDRPETDSGVVDALIHAAGSGKSVTVAVELQTRFQEKHNARLAIALQDAGVEVICGVPGHQLHWRMALVTRREEGLLRRYVHFGTGSYHRESARPHVDYGLLSADPLLAGDVHHLFLQMGSLMPAPPLQRLLQTPFGLRRQLLSMIGQEAANVTAGGNGHIIVKLNALTDPDMIDALYQASAAGVFIDLIIRGACSLRPGVPGISDNIRLRSIVGRFPEHSRVCYFHANGAEHLFLSSGDWTEDSFSRHLEVCISITDAAMKQRILGDMDVWLSDNCEAWELQADGSYRRSRPPPDEPRHRAQSVLLLQLGASVPPAAVAAAALPAKRDDNPSACTQRPDAQRLR